MNFALTALEQAWWLLQHRDDYSREERINNAIALHEWGVFAKRQIAEIVGLNRELVRRLLHKPERTGRRLNVETIPLLLAIKFSDKEEWPDLLRIAIDRGTSVGMCALLLDVSESAIKWLIREKEEA